ncbi:SDR family NAD(P)-dependent oxidoreductase [Actinoplanes sp. NPDC051494]|uniref:SDR family NAD(P)-dependent oxidoreductase n=1 Tax=Actinoplanes sp. NPDC051494 TaxID=3363907 RepID=UPI00379FD3F8
MPIIVIVGAGPGLGMEIARAFGRRGFGVALLARDAAKLETLVEKLGAEGIVSAGFTADILQPDTVTQAFIRIKQRFGAIDVLEFSPVDREMDAVGLFEVTPKNLQPHLDFYVHGAIHCVRQVVDDMIAAGSGTILVTTGGGSITPVPSLANINLAASGLRNWVLNLHNVLKPKGVYAAHVAISTWIGGGHPDAAADVIANRYVELYETRIEPELNHLALDA